MDGVDSVKDVGVGGGACSPVIGTTFINVDKVKCWLGAGKSGSDEHSGEAFC